MKSKMKYLSLCLATLVVSGCSVVENTHWGGKFGVGEEINPRDELKGKPTANYTCRHQDYYQRTPRE